MSQLLFVGLLLLVWLGAWGSLRPLNALLGLGLALGIRALFVRLYQARTGRLGRKTRVRPVALAGLVVAFVYEVARSAISVALEAVRPRIRVRPGVIGIPLEAETDVQITILATLVSLTPGTLSLEVAPDGDCLYVHALHVEDDGGEIRRSVKLGFERRVLAAFPAASRRP